MYLLDTNAVSEMVRARPDRHFATRFLATGEGELFTSVIAIEEIRYGARIGPPGNQLWERTESLVLVRVTVVELDEFAARLAGDLRGDWKRAGTPVGYPDGLIAATALRRGWTLVTRNVRHFDHVSGLKIENWFVPPPLSAADPS